MPSVADREIDPQHDLARDLGEVEHLVDDVERNMRGGIGEGADPDHAPHIHDSGEAPDAAQRRHRQGQQNKHQRPIAGAVDQVVDRPGAEPVLRERRGDRERNWRHEQQKRDDAERRHPAAVVTPELKRRRHGTATTTPDLAAHRGRREKPAWLTGI